MSDSKNNPTKGDYISVIALLLMGVIVFFGMNFKTLGDRIPSIAVAILIVVLMIVFVFLAAYAKAQDRYQSAWNVVRYAMLVLYVLALIPCYALAARFFDVQFDKANIMEQVQNDTNGLNKLFSDYSRLCDSRATAYKIQLDSQLSTPEGRQRIANYLKISDPSTITQKSIDDAVSAFSKMLKGAAFNQLMTEKNDLVAKCESNFKNWNILYIPKDAYELGTAKSHFAKELEGIYNKAQNNLETKVPPFNPDTQDSDVLKSFEGNNQFSVAGFLAVLILGALGLVKYLLGKKSAVIPLKEGESSSIEKDGGYII